VEATIEIKGVGHVYKGGVEALKGVDLQIGKGLFGLLGPNGAGKSTLMKIMCTLIKPTEGSVRLAGADVVEERRKVRAAIGYLPQDFGAWRLQRVEEVVDILARLSGLADKKVRKERVHAVLEQVGLDQVAGRKVKKLSGGMLRRLGVAQALVHAPQFLVVDEPTVGLDPEERLRFRKLMGQLAKEKTIVLSTHIVADLGSACRDLALIAKGKIVYRGAPEGLLEHAKSRVFEMVLPIDRAEDLGREFEIVSRVRDGVGIRVRAVALHGSPPADSIPIADPTLEEGYLAFMAEHGERVHAETPKVAEVAS